MCSNYNMDIHNYNGSSSVGLVGDNQHNCSVRQMGSTMVHFDL
jgi:hypothetical protein